MLLREEENFPIMMSEVGENGESVCSKRAGRPRPRGPSDCKAPRLRRRGEHVARCRAVMATSARPARSGGGKAASQFPRRRCLSACRRGFRRDRLACLAAHECILIVGNHPLGVPKTLERSTQGGSRPSGGGGGGKSRCLSVSRVETGTPGGGVDVS